MVTNADSLGLLQLANASGNEAWKTGADKAAAQKAQDAALSQLITGKQMDASNEADKLKQQDQYTRDHFKMAHDNAVEDAGKGIKTTSKLGDASTSINETDPAAKAGSQAQAFLKTAQAAYKPINEQLDASQSTLDNLDKHSSVGDRLAWLNEARLAAGSGGSKALKTFVDVLSHGQTANMSFQDTINWMNNTPEIPTMPDGMRDSVRQSVHDRLDQVGQQHQMASNSLAQQGAIVAPGVNYQGLIGSLSGPAQQKLAQLQQRRDEYNKQRAAMNPTRNVTNPTVADPNQSNLDKFIGLFKSKPPQAPAPRAAPQMTFEEFKAAKAAGKL